MLIYVKNINKKKLFTDRQTDRQTDGRTDGQPKTIVRNLTKSKKTFATSKFEIMISTSFFANRFFRTRYEKKVNITRKKNLL
jgi:hypothetical protein